MMNAAEILIPETMYHVYNRSNGNEQLFLSTENYRYFLQKYQEHILPVAYTYCYCLMPNHFHFLIQIKTEAELKALPAFPKFETLEKLLSKQFSNFFSAYTQAFNKQNNRKGSLFIKNFKRKAVNDQTYLRKLVHYIHHNPLEAKLCTQPQNWPHSSYPVLIADTPTFLKRNEVINWFENSYNFIYCHTQVPELSGIHQ